MMRILSAALLLLACAPALVAQGPSADWRTVETEHFRVHYPHRYEAWALRAAERLEPIHAAVSEEVGFTPPQRIDVLVMNPIAEPNGMAWPLLDTPRIIFFTEPPGPDEQLGAYGSWIELLAVHEVAHVVHMLRPSRNPLQAFLERSVLPLNPITLRAPRWVLEGYATVIEGRLTGAGRPTSTIRALILREWAANGRLPSYGQLDSDRRFLGMSMAYLMGSAFLEWLEQRNGSGSLRSVWARMTARERRSFDEAFIGVFGERPDRLYGQFVAELTASAVAVRRARPSIDGALFQETSRASGSPAVSPDGSHVAVVIRPRDQPERLVIWPAAEPEEAIRKDRERIGKMLARDPEDVAPVRVKPLPRKAEQTLVLPDGGDIQSPRWTRDGRSIVFTHRVPDADGVLHFDVFVWGAGDRAASTAGRALGDQRWEVRRVTHLAGVREIDVLDDDTLIGVRSAYGMTQLVEVDLRTGAVTPRSEASLERVIASPRVSPDGRIAYVANERGRWTLVADGREIALPGDAATPAWVDERTLFVTLFARGFAEVYRVNVDEGEAVAVTRTDGGAFEPSPAPDGRLFFMSLEPDGYVLRLLGRAEAVEAAPVLPETLVPAIPPLPSSDALVARDATVAPSEPRPYGIGRQEVAWLASQNFGPEQQAFEAGLRIGDVVGRLDTLLIASLAREDAPDGVALASAWRGWPVEVHGHLFRADDENGGELRGVWSRRFRRARVTFESGVLRGEDDLLFGSVAASTWQRRGAWWLEQGGRIDVDDQHWRAVASFGMRAGALRIGARFQHDEGTTVTLGGLPSSILPRSAYAHRVLDPALPVAIAAGDEYDGWRIETTVPGLPFTAFYQRHEFGGEALSLAGAELEIRSAPNPIVKVPGLDLTLGVARVFDEPLRGETKWWIGMRWRP